MQQGFEERYLDVLQNIEAAIMMVYGNQPALLDSEVDAALEALIARYAAEERGRTPQPAHLPGNRQEVYDKVSEVCEWRLGRGDLASIRAAEPEMNVEPERKTVGEIVACLKRIRKSVARMTKTRGRQGYLTFVSGFL